MRICSYFEGYRLYKVKENIITLPKLLTSQGRTRFSPLTTLNVLGLETNLGANSFPSNTKPAIK